MENDGYYEAYWPRGARQQRTRALAPRLDTLEGKTVAQLWDQLFKGDVVFEILEEGLRERFPGVKFVSWREFGSTHGGEEKEALAALPANSKRSRSWTNVARSGNALPCVCGNALDPKSGKSAIGVSRIEPSGWTCSTT